MCKTKRVIQFHQIIIVESAYSPMLRCVANDMNRWEIFPSLLIGTIIFKMAAAVSLLLLQIGLFWQHK